LNENFKIEARLGRVHAPHDGDVSRAGAQRKKKRLFFLFSPVSPGYAPAMWVYSTLLRRYACIE
jgi:hypothetical protein